jgi:hypothetical protein
MKNLALKENNLRIMNMAPSSLDSELVGRMRSFSFKCNYTVIFTRKDFPRCFNLFDVGKIVSVEPGISNKSATIEVDYGKNDGKCKVELCLNDYVTDKVKVSNKSSRLRFLE